MNFPSFNQRLLWRLMLVPAIIMMVFFGVLFWSLNYAGDEYRFAVLFKTKKYFDVMHLLYFKESFRYATFTFYYLIYGVIKDSLFYPLIKLIVFSFLFIVWIISLKNILLFAVQKCPNFSITTFQLYVLTMMFIAQLFFTTSQASEVWASVCGLICYIMPFIFLSFGISCCLFVGLKVIQYPSIILSSILVAGSAENVSLFLIITCSFFLLIFSPKINADFRRKFLLFFGALFVASMVTYFSKGTLTRAQFDSVISNHCVPKNLTGYYVFTFYDLLLNLFSARFWVGLILYFPWLIFGAIGSKNLELIECSKMVLKATLFLLLFCLMFHVALTQFLFGNYGYMRIWFPVNFFTTLFFSSLFFYVGVRYLTRISVHFLFVFFTIGITFCYCSIHIINMLKFNNAYYTRVNYLKDNSNIFVGKVISIETLPASGILCSSDITSNPDHYMNYYFVTVHGLNFKVKLDK